MKLTKGDPIFTCLDERVVQKPYTAQINCNYVVSVQ